MTLSKPILVFALLLLAGCDSQPAADRSTETDQTITEQPDHEAQRPEAQLSEAQLSESPVINGMVWVEGGGFVMGSEDELSRLNERPAHQVIVDGFWMDVTPVTNAQFAKFAQETGYTTIAERKPDWEELKKSLPPGTPKPDDSLLVAGSMVFVPSSGPVDLRDMRNFWQWMPGASWRHPEGPDSDITGREDHPVVQVAFYDAVEYASWAGKSLPTEAQWEYAARGGTTTRYHWGEEFQPDGKLMANTWNGSFPYRNTKLDGFERTAPVKSFAKNGYGLFGMAGNVWNWCTDSYRPDTYQSRADEVCSNPTGPLRPGLPTDLDSTQRVVKGGSFLCHADYCASYRPSARRGLPADTGMSHVGFRCIQTEADGPKPTQ